MNDRSVLYFAAFVRALATGMIGVMLGLYLAKLELSPQAIGLAVGAGLSGVALATLLVTLYGDRLGRRRFLLGVTLLAGGGAIVSAMASHPLLLTLSCFIGMLNGMGRDRSAASVVEQAMLPATVSDEQRTQTFAWYSMLQDIGHALGGLMAGLPTLLQHSSGLSVVNSFRASVGIYAGLILLTGLAYLLLSPGIEVQNTTRQAPLSPESKRVLIRISALFSIDGLGGGFLTASLISYFFYQRFGVSELEIGGLFFLARVANAFSHLGAAWLAKKIGLVNTMVFTHIPSSLLLVTVAFAPSFEVAALLFLLREGLVEMDVPTRSSYVMAVVRPEERTRAAGVTLLVRVAAWAVAPTFAGLFMQQGSLMWPLIIGAAMKISYDILLYLAFRNVRPPEEAHP